MKLIEWKWIPIIAVLLGFAYYLHQIDAKYDSPSEFEVKNFPLFSQPDGVSCGPTSLQMILKYYQNEQPLSEIRKHTRTDLFVRDGVEIGGTTPEYMELALEHYDVDCHIETATVEKLKWYVSRGITPVVLVRSGKRFWHYVVVIGYTEDTIITADPSGGRRRVLTTEQFQNAWDFTSDLHGRDITSPCPGCDGDGWWSDYLGPFGKCDLCNGTGRFPDWLRFLVQAGEANPNIAIVPNYPPKTSQDEMAETT